MECKVILLTSFPSIWTDNDEVFYLQELIVLRAIRDVNVPKFLQDDLKLFNGIVSDLFPQIRDVPVDYGDLERSIRATSVKKRLQDVDGKMTYHTCMVWRTLHLCMHTCCIFYWCLFRVCEEVYSTVWDYRCPPWPHVGRPNLLRKNQGTIHTVCTTSLVSFWHVWLDLLCFTCCVLPQVLWSTKGCSDCHQREGGFWWVQLWNSTHVCPQPQVHHHGTALWRVWSSDSWMVRKEEE